MGLWDSLKQHAGAQFLDVIEWLDDTRNTLVYRFPVFNQAIQDGGRLVVREGQSAVFIAEGRLSEVFTPGTYELSTRTKAISSFFESVKYQLNYPYKGDIYFVNTRRFTDQKWGTPQPLAVRDPDFGSIQIRAFGTYAYRVTDPGRFLREVVGTDGLFTTDEINGQLKRKVLSVFASLLRDAKIPFDMLVGAGLELSEALREKLTPIFEESYGIAVTDFTVDGVTLPPKVQEYYEKRQGMAMVGDLDAYSKLQSADAIQDAARNPGIGGAGVGMGVGFAMGNQVAGTMAQGQQAQGRVDPHSGLGGQKPQAAPPPPPTATARYHYHGPSGQAELPLEQVVERIAADRDADHHLWMPGWSGWKPWDQVEEVKNAVPAAPPPPPAATAFHYHGPGGQTQELPLEEVIRRVAADREGRHLVWTAGFDGWKPALEVPEIAEALERSAPPPPPGSPPPPPDQG